MYCAVVVCVISYTPQSYHRIMKSRTHIVIRRCLPLAVLLFISSNSQAQEADPPNYFPLETGNMWTYFQVLDPPNAPPDTLWKGTYSVEAAQSVNDTLYYEAEYAFSLVTMLRTDEEGNVWTRMEGEDVLLFDFTMAEGDSYTFQSPQQPELVFHVTIERNLTIDVAAGHFENCVKLRFDDPMWIDDAHTYAFAPDVGIVYAYGNGGDYAELYSAEVAGNTITSIETDPSTSSAGNGAYAYPNPFRRSTTIVFPSKDAHSATVSIHDVLGRRVETLSQGACNGETCVFYWDAAASRTGTYYASLERFGVTKTVQLVFNR